MNSFGPSTDPWGTPQAMSKHDDVYTNHIPSPALTSLTASWRQMRLSSANRVVRSACRFRLLSCSSAIRSLCFLSGQVRGSSQTGDRQVTDERRVTNRWQTGKGDRQCTLSSGHGFSHQGLRWVDLWPPWQVLPMWPHLLLPHCLTPARLPRHCHSPGNRSTPLKAMQTNNTDYFLERCSCFLPCDRVHKSSSSSHLWPSTSRNTEHRCDWQVSHSGQGDDQSQVRTPER